mmetsp:Transcript_2052/g.3262  ORF Transcript_2052/g.3262 Transcript_2052/m.3262 type:complete len:134 (-) Transcript_2052:1619-2020(-)
MGLIFMMIHHLGHHQLAQYPSILAALRRQLPICLPSYSGEYSIKSASSPALCALLRANINILASSDGSVRLNLLSASSRWLFWVNNRDIPENVEVGRDIEVDQHDHMPASPIMILLAGTTLAHGWLSTLSSYH